MDAMSRHRGGKDALTEDEMVANAHFLILAGSETTASLLSGLTYHLLQNLPVYERLKRELRESFATQKEITFAVLGSKCPYLMACLKEGLRMYPPVPGMLPRMTLEEKVISGYVIPKGVHVGVHQSSAFWSERNFARAGEFVPERWLGESEKEGAEFQEDSEYMLPCSLLAVCAKATSNLLTVTIYRTLQSCSLSTLVRGIALGATWQGRR